MGLGEEVEVEREAGWEFNTFRVYLAVLRLGDCSARDVSRFLGFSSPALSVHHLEKLGSLGLVTKDSFGVYHVVRRRFGLLRFFVLVGKFVVPRSLFYALFYGVVGVFSLFLLSGVVRNVVLLFCVLGFVIHVVETVMFYRVLPKGEGVQKVEQAVQEND